MNLVNADFRCHALLNEIYRDRKVGVEIGVFRGDLSWRLIASNKNIFLYMVDPWKESTEGDTYLTTTDYVASMSQDDHNRNMRIATAAVEKLPAQYEVLRMTSLDASRRFGENSIDFVFIDGDHSYEGCSLDISLWYPKLKDGGLLSGHDYRTKDNYGVIRAVDEFVSKTGKQLRLGANYTWFATK